MPRISNALLAVGAAALLSGQAAYAAPSSIDPLVALSALAGDASRAAVCAGSTAASAAAAATAAAAQAAAPGCVLPVNAPPPVAEAPGAPPPPVVQTAAAPKSIGTWPILLGLAVLVGIAALLLSDNGNGNGSVTPISPA